MTGSWISFATLSMGLALCGCSGLPKAVDRPASTALTDTSDTRLGRAAAPALAAHPGQSGFYPISQGADAFVGRVALARAADRSLDVQYYVFHADQTGLGLLAELLAAADRGVRVRLLLDDIHTGGQDQALAAVDAHPNVEVRLFNPFANRGARWMDLAGDFGRVNRRMHNKSMTADNQATIVGGRNIGDEYFQAKEDLDFSDLDVLGVGPVAPQVSKVFDQYWNSEEAYPLSAFRSGKAPTEAQIRKLRDDLSRSAEALRRSSHAGGLAETGLAKAISTGQIHLYWGRATVIADDPTKVRLPPEDASTHAIPKLLEYLSAAKEELLLVSPYFVPGKEGVKFLTDTASRGVRVIILTNSFAATDVSAVHAGYAPSREDLLRAGIQLYELKPSAGADGAKAADKRLTGSSSASLHAKTYMVDRHVLFVGSLNLDPRSARLNTEMGVVMDSAELCAVFRGGFDEKILDVAYRVELVQSPGGKQRLVWVTREGGQEKRYDREPGIGFFQSIGQGFLRILPVQNQL